MHLRAGMVVSAVIDADPTLPPKKALYRMVSWAEGGFEFVAQEGDLPQMPNEITDTTEQLIIEACNRRMSSPTVDSPRPPRPSR